MHLSCRWMQRNKIAHFGSTIAEMWRSFQSQKKKIAKLLGQDVGKRLAPGTFANGLLARLELNDNLCEGAFVLLLL